MTFFIAIGLLLFLWPRLTFHAITNHGGERIAPADSATLTGYVLTVLYLMSPLEQILGWLPFLGWAMGSVAQIERLGLALDEEAEEQGTGSGEQAAPAQRVGE